MLFPVVIIRDRRKVFSQTYLSISYFYTIYTFEFKDGVYADNYPGKWQGVMADEVEKIDGAVFNFKGVNWVDYKKLDVQFKKIKS